MKIAQLIWSLRRGGAEKACLDISGELIRRGHDVSIITLSPVHEWNDEGCGAHSGVRAVPMFRDRAPRWREDLPLLSWRLRQHLRTLQPAVVHSHCLASTIASFMAGCPPHIATLHGARSAPLGGAGRPADILNRMLYRQAVFSRPAILTVTTREAVPLACQRLRLSSSRVRVIPNGVDLASGLPGPGTVDRGACRVGMVGSLIEVKNHVFAVEVLRALRDMGIDASLAICGEGRLRERLVDQICTLRLEDHVHLLGQCADVGSFLRSIDVFWMTSLSEGHSIALLEAMAAAVPCVVVDTPGLGAFAREWDCALVVPAGDVQALAEATACLLRDHGWAREMAWRGYSVVRTHFTLKRTVEEYEQLYETVCHSGGVHRQSEGG